MTQTPAVQLVVNHLDGQTCYYPANTGWRVDPRDRCLVIGRGLPRKHIPLDTVASFDIESVGKRPNIVVLCGSTRFSDAFREANLRETLAGRIVLSIGCEMCSDAALFADLSEEKLADIKADLDELHKRKIDLADEVLVLNVGGYIGDSTRDEIAYATRLGKPIRWLEEPIAYGNKHAADVADEAAENRCVHCREAIAKVGDTWYHDVPNSTRIRNHDAEPANLASA